MKEADRARLIAGIATRLRIRLDEDDPAFVLVELNLLILEQTIRDVVDKLMQIEPRIAARFGQDPRNAQTIANAVAERVGEMVETRVKNALVTLAASPAVAGASKYGREMKLSWPFGLVLVFALSVVPLAFGYFLGASGAVAVR